MGACYIFHSKRLEKNIDSLRNTFNSRLSNFTLAYSFKTNCHPLVLETIRRKNVLAEVVSPYEFQVAMENGFNANEIIYNGVCKDKEQTELCLEKNGRVNIDNREDLEYALDMAERTGERPRLGIRISFEIGNCIKSRFGIETDSSLYQELRELEKNGIIEIEGLSCHFTKAKERIFWQRRIQNMTENALDFQNIRYLDFGGNIAGKWETPRGKQDRHIAEPEYIADTMHDELAAKGISDKNIIIESGTALVGSTVDIKSKVLHIKDNGFIIMDIGFLDMLLPSMSDSIAMEIIPSGNPQSFLKGQTITGYTCLENDIIKRGFNGKLAEGDFILFKNMGAYTWAMAGDFIMKKPAFKTSM